MLEIIWLSAREVIDSLGSPTLAVSVELFGGALGQALVPTDSDILPREAKELRDRDPHRYSGHGVQGAVQSVVGDIARLLRGRQFADLSELDHAMLELDGTRNKSRLGRNALMGVSMAVARAQSNAIGTPLWYCLQPDGVEACLPVPYFSMVGSSSRPRKTVWSDIMIAPIGALSFSEALRAGSEIHGALGSILDERGLPRVLNHQGSFISDLGIEPALDLLLESIESAGYQAGLSDVAIAVNGGAGAIYHEEKYNCAGLACSTDDMIERYRQLIASYPIVSIEDGLADSDWIGWKRMASKLGHQVQLAGGDIFVSNPEIIAGGIVYQVANAALIKPAQVGTVSQALEAIRVCREAGWGQVVSHCAGETGDSFISDLAVAVGCGQIQAGAPVGGERVAKYNRLIEIEADAQLPYNVLSHRDVGGELSQSA